MLPALLEALRGHRNAVLVAPPGAGKTTRVPPAVLAAGLSQGGRILLAQPRRLAARAAARRMAEEHGWEVGKEVGYRLRYERQEGPATRILAVTEGLLVHLLQRDPLLHDVGALLFDEIHERNLDGDLGLALALRVQQEVRPDLRILAMSATLDPGPLGRLLGDCPVVASEGRQFPVTIEHRPGRDERAIAGLAASAVREVLPRTPGDLLVFLPGVGEIAAVERALGDLSGVDVLPLHGQLSTEDQDRALRRGTSRRVVLATNVAETSVTVDGVTAVIDSGWQRQLRFDPGAGVDRLELRRISHASATQRAGRAGRQSKGLCIRLWSEEEQRALLACEAPAIERIDLAGAVLQIRAFGESDAAALDWLDPPARSRIAVAEQLLTELGALGPHGVTAHGRVMAALPLHPRLGRLAIAGYLLGAPVLACRAAALLAEGDVVERGAGAAVVASESDVLDRLHALEDHQRRRRSTVGGRALRTGRVGSVLRSARDVEQRLRRLLGRPPDATEPGEAGLRRALLAAYSDRLARRRAPGSDRAVMVGGRGLRLARESAVKAAELLLAVEIAGRGGERGEDLVHIASAVDSEWIEQLCIEEQVLRFDPAARRVRTFLVRRVKDLLLDEREVETPRSPEVSGLLLSAASAAFSEALGLERREIAGWLRRLRWLAQELPEIELPRFDEAQLRFQLRLLCEGRRSFEELATLPLLGILAGRLSWEQQRELEQQAPTHLRLPSGRRAPIEYREDGPPMLAARIQELFGWRQTPRVARGRVPLVLQLLAPNQRPQQVTDDLASFWRETYAEVRKELRGRYPKHAWPENPLDAVPSGPRRDR